ncbi:odorant receptor 49a-like [Belonocnema kinseyi]|uniref:odorant receptor 49a-like n=1 Tax=Belonocnema kinseyi TaxID=2817044 RepID=UPI00143D0276|nr:odorant receptor 49a-like [Belonocnema kinseyi]
MWIGLFKAVGDINLLFECFPPIVILTFGNIMFFNFIINANELKMLLEKIEKDWIIWSTEPEFRILKNYAEAGKKFRVAYFVTLMGVLACFMAVPGLPQFLNWVRPLNDSRPKEYIYYTEYGIDVEEYYIPIFLHSYFFSFINFILLLNGDMMFMACTQHVCGVLAAMGFKLKNLINENLSMERDNNYQTKIDNKIIFCIKQHQELIVFLENMHKCFSFVFLATVLFNMLIISVTGVQTVMNLEHPEVAFRFASSTVGQMFHLFFLTIPCQQMIDLSLNISDSVYTSNWYILPSRSRKLLLMLMRRSSEPFEFIVAKLYTYSMQNFGVVIKTSISYFTVLVSLQ